MKANPLASGIVDFALENEFLSYPKSGFINFFVHDMVVQINDYILKRACQLLEYVSVLGCQVYTL